MHFNIREICFAECIGIGDPAFMALTANLKKMWENPMVQVPAIISVMTVISKSLVSH